MNIRFVMQWLMLFSFLLLSVKVQSEVVEKVISCQLGSQQSATLFREHRIADTYIYSLQQDNQNVSLLYNNKNESRGMDVKAQCVGMRKNEQLLVVSGEFSSNYIQGLVLRYNSKTEQWERINFAERNRPMRIYVSDKEMMVVIPNQGNDTDKKYLVYTYVSSKGQTEETRVIDTLPLTGEQYLIPQ
jgi:hypothetical protein